MAGKLILSDILSMHFCKDEYPHPEDLASVEKQLSFIPSSLSELLMIIIQSKKRDLKMVGIGQAIVQAARPRAVIAPVQIGLGVQMHHHFRSKHLIQTLNKLGFCSSYAEVQKFKLSAAISTKNETHQENAKKVI